jgi:hypothetical protein
MVSHRKVTNVGLLDENHLNINLIAHKSLLLNEVYSLSFVEHSLHLLIKELDPRSVIVIVQS